MVFINSISKISVKHWCDNIKATTPIQILDNQTDIFNYTITSVDIFILDVDLFKNTKEMLLFISSLPKNLKIIAIKKDLSLAEGTLLVKKGVRAYCHYIISKTVLRRIIKTVEAGDTWVYPALMSYIIKNINIDNEATNQQVSLDKLSKKEQEVALLVASGSSNKEIATVLDVALVTVKKHVGKIFEKLEVKDRVSLSILINN